MKDDKYIWLDFNLIPREIVKKYNLHDYVHNRQVYMEIRKGMYGLPQARKLANDLLNKRLAPHGYVPIPHTPGLWKHCTKPVWFTLMVDDFGIKYIGDKNLQHLIDTLKQYYKITVFKARGKYLGITIAWNYDNKHFDISVPDYVRDALQKFGHPTPKQPHHAPSKYIPP